MLSDKKQEVYEYVSMLDQALDLLAVSTTPEPMSLRPAYQFKVSETLDELVLGVERNYISMFEVKSMVEKAISLAATNRSYQTIAHEDMKRWLRNNAPLT